ncbi:SDR family oxidoreductase [bacterium]|nr:SDR family oxidoreductase [bacterium]
MSIQSDFFRDRVVVITGASSGIGEQLALKLPVHGARVALASRSGDRLEELAARIGAEGREVLTVRTDVSSEPDVDRLIQTVRERWKRIDVFISNAGQYIQGSIEESPPDRFHASLAVNFFASMYAVTRLIPLMSAQGSGSIVFINSLDAKKGIVGDAPYAAAKSALDRYGDILRQEVREKGIHVLSVYPGRVDTAMIGHIQVPRMSPKISPGRVADAVIRGIRRKKAVVTVPGLYRPLGAGNDLFPRVFDRLYKWFRLEGRVR